LIFYFFNSDFDTIKELDSAGFDGVLFRYNASGEDYFTKIINNLNPKSNMKYMVAIRPYAISPQYLCMINQSFKNIIKDRLQINFISGQIKDNEKNLGGILGQVNEHSSSIDRSNYLIEYIDLLESLKTEIPDYYVSVTNQFTFKAAIKNNSKMIVPYYQYENKVYDLNNTRTMIAMTPVLRESKKDFYDLSQNKEQSKAQRHNFTYNEFRELINSLKYKNINEMIFSACNSEETQNIIKFVKEYKKEEVRL
jgi:phosphoglycolate phosphatase-like HAD superfamily hydrolase